MDELNFLKSLEQKGVLFTAQTKRGYCFMDAGDILEWSRNPIDFEASSYGVSKEIYLGWLHRECRAKTRRGETCKITLVEWPDHPKDFTFGISDRCHVHLGK